MIEKLYYLNTPKYLHCVRYLMWLEDVHFLVVTIIFSQRQLTSLNPSWSNSNTTTTYSGPFNFAQFFLEEEDEGDHLRKLQDLQALSDYNFAPVLLWKPSSASKQRKLKQKQATSEGDSNAGERKLKKMNLIDNLPINKQETTTFKQPEVCSRLIMIWCLWY